LLVEAVLPLFDVQAKSDLLIRKTLFDVLLVFPEGTSLDGDNQS
jgi:hypothetical protein